MPRITATESLVIAGVVAGVGYVVYRGREKATLQKEAMTAQKEGLGEPVQPEGAGFVAWPVDAAFRRGNEILNAKIVVVTKPLEHAGYVGLPTSNNWLTNVAFWMTYPEALGFPDGKIPSNFKSVPDWKKFASAWVRIFKLVKKYRAEPLPKPILPKLPPLVTEKEEGVYRGVRWVVMWINLTRKWNTHFLVDPAAWEGRGLWFPHVYSLDGKPIEMTQETQNAAIAQIKFDIDKWIEFGKPAHATELWKQFVEATGKLV